MGFVQPYTNPANDVTVAKAYHVVTNTSLNYGAQSAGAVLQVFSSREAYKAGKEPISITMRGPGGGPGGRPNPQQQQEQRAAAQVFNVRVNAAASEEDAALYAQLAGAADLRALFYAEFKKMEQFSGAKDA